MSGVLCVRIGGDNVIDFLSLVLSRNGMKL